MTASDIISRSPRVPMPSGPVLRLFRLLGQPDVDATEVTALVQQDAVLTGRLLAYCNSAAMGFPTRVGTIDEAVFYLGHSEVQRLVITLGLGPTARPKLAGYFMAEGELWRHTLFTAMVTEKVLARAHGNLVDPGVAYTAGLLHDFGKLIFTHTLDEATRDAVRALIQQEKLPLVEAEHRVMGTDHAEVGARLLKDWALPDVIVNAVAFHHKPTADGGSRLAAVVHVADLLAHEAGSAPGFDGLAVEVDTGALDALALTPDVMTELLMDAMEVAAEVEQIATQT